MLRAIFGLIVLALVLAIVSVFAYHLGDWATNDCSKSYEMVGLVTDVRYCPTSSNETFRSQVVTTEGFFIVYGQVSCKKNAVAVLVHSSGLRGSDWLEISGTDGKSWHLINRCRGGN